MGKEGQNYQNCWKNYAMNVVQVNQSMKLFFFFFFFPEKNIHHREGGRCWVKRPELFTRDANKWRNWKIVVL